MSAEVYAEYVYSPYCADCNEGAGPGTDEEIAQDWADRHNKEYHA